MSNPPNPWGSCFDATAHNFLANRDVDGLRVCHGICVANKEGQEGMTIGHAWLEFDHQGERAAMDCIWLHFREAAHYRRSLQSSYVVEYTPEEFMRLWTLHDYPGPWDERVIAVTAGKIPTHAK